MEVPPRVTSATIPLTWGATDEQSGVARYDVAVRVEDGEWTAWLTGTLDTEASYAIGEGKWFAFRVTATDNVGNSTSTEALARFPRVTKYYYSGGRRVAMRQGGVVYYLHADHLGSVSLVTNHASEPVAEQRFLPYGGLRWSEGTLPTDFGFAGQQHVPGTGLVFMHARYYHPALARWTQADTIVPEAGNPQALNRYSYAVGNPVRYNDPTGHAYWKGDDGWVIPSTQYNAPIERGWTAHDTKIVVGTMVTLVGIAAVPEMVGAGVTGVEAVGWKALEWTLGHQTLAKILGFGVSLATRELADADDDEVRAAQRLLDALQSEGGRVQLDPSQQINTEVLAQLQRLGDAAIEGQEEFAVIVAQDGQVHLLQMSQLGFELPADTAEWLLHTHSGADLAASGLDQHALGYLTRRAVEELGYAQSQFSIIVNENGEAVFFWAEGR